jgi:hypothetical protein
MSEEASILQIQLLFVRLEPLLLIMKLILLSLHKKREMQMKQQFLNEVHPPNI